MIIYVYLIVFVGAMNGVYNHFVLVANEYLEFRHAMDIQVSLLNSEGTLGGTLQLDAIVVDLIGTADGTFFAFKSKEQL